MSKKRINASPLKQKIERLLNQQHNPIAVFDADGTIWAKDINNLFLNYQLENNIRDLKDLLDPLYGDEKHRGRRCGQFVCRQAGLSLKDLKQQFKAALKSQDLTVFPFQRDLMEYLKQKAIRIFIVTASMQWLVEEAVQLFCLPVDRVLGVRVKLKRGVLTDQLIPPLTFGEGKKQVFLRETGDKTPLFAAGNSPSDCPLMEMASVTLTVHSASKEDTENFPLEVKMKQLAQKKGWLLLDYSSPIPALKDFSKKTAGKTLIY